MTRLPRPWSALFAAPSVLLLGACATTQPTAAPPSPTPVAAAAATTAQTAPRPAGAASAPAAAGPAAAPTAGARPATPAGAPAPFADVTKDAKRAAGLLPLWTKDDKTWLEIPAEWLDKPLFFASSIAGGLGERGFWPGLTGGSQLVVFKRQGNSVQLIARNMGVRAPAGTPLARAVDESYSDSLLAAAPLAAAPHPQSKALLVDAAVLLGGDLLGLQTRLESAYRLPYALDRANGSIERSAAKAEATTLTMRQHFAVPKLPAPPVTAPGAPPPNPAALPNPPSVVPDARSLFIDVALTFAPLPAQPMRVRKADPRVGFFTTAYTDFGDDTQEGKRTHLARRWRLEKADPAAAVSRPKEPIRVVMDRNIPEQWRPAVRAGIVEWNKAFERAGFQDAIVVEQQAADADWSSLEGTRFLAVRWFAQEGPGATAVGPSQSDPRTGEMLRGAAIIPENWVRIFRARVSDLEPPLPGAGAAPLSFADPLLQCEHGAGLIEQAAFGAALLEARGEFDPKGPKAGAFIAASLKDVTMHEVGHALGLRHNFRASAGITQAQLRDSAFTARRGVSNSVMDYNGMNTPREGEPLADYFMPTLGAYDFHAIEWGYREFAPADEAAGLAALAKRSETDPALAYATDEDVIAASDPLVNHRDLGDDPLAYAQRQAQLVRELWAKTQQRKPAADDDLTLNRRNLTRGFAMLAQALPMVTKYVGGSHTSRASAGANQPVFAPVAAAQQRAALDLLISQAFDARSFRFEPAFLQRLGIDQFERFPRGGFGASVATAGFSVAGEVLRLQRPALDALVSDALAQRLADAELATVDRKQALGYSEVQQRLLKAVWAELGQDGDIDPLRRNLQREHLKRLAGSLLRPAAATAVTDVRPVHRATLLQLQQQLRTALKDRRWNDTARAHLDDSLALIGEALGASLTRQGV